MMLCQHEETAVQIAHGYAKASGKPMVAILHNLVGLLHANMAIYYAYIDRAPVFIIGATGPMDETKRRPRIDWIHTALVQGEAVRALHQVGLPADASSTACPNRSRAPTRVMMTEPRGPDLHVLRRLAAGAAARRTSALAAEADSVKVPTPAGGGSGGARERRPTCCSTPKRPVILAEYVGRDHGGVFTRWSSWPRRSARRSTTSTAASISPAAIRST